MLVRPFPFKFYDTAFMPFSVANVEWAYNRGGGHGFRVQQSQGSDRPNRFESLLLNRRFDRPLLGSSELVGRANLYQFKTLKLEE
jgi:hypothetical protein